MVYGHISLYLKKAECLMHGIYVRVNLMTEWHDFLLRSESFESQRVYFILLRTLLDTVGNVIFVIEHRPNLE